MLNRAAIGKSFRGEAHRISQALEHLALHEPQRAMAAQTSAVHLFYLFILFYYLITLHEPQRAMTAQTSAVQKFSKSNVLCIVNLYM